MKRNQYRSITAKCPFYKREDRQTILCSGIVEDSSVHLAFGRDADCIDYKTKLCRSNYRLCKVYKMLEEMYDG